MPTRELRLKGVIPQPYCPSSYLLQVELDVTGLFTDRGDDYIGFKQKLEDKLNNLDRSYAKEVNRLRGRGVDAKYRTITDGKKKTRGRFIDMMPYPSTFASRLSQIRTDFYDAIRDAGGIPLAETTHGRRKFVTYFMLEAQAARLTRSTTRLNQKVDELNEDIEKFERKHDFAELLSFIKGFVPHERWSRDGDLHSHIHYIGLNLTPMPISKELVDMYMDDKVKAQVRASITQSVEKITENFQLRLSAWIKTLNTALQGEVKKSTVDQLAKTFEEIKAESQEYQVHGIITEQFRVCEALAQAIQTNDPISINDAADKVARYAGVEGISGTGRSREEVLAEAGLKMADVSKETRALIETLL